MRSDSVWLRTFVWAVGLLQKKQRDLGRQHWNWLSYFFVYAALVPKVVAFCSKGVAVCAIHTSSEQCERHPHCKTPHSWWFCKHWIATSDLTIHDSFVFILYFYFYIIIIIKLYRARYHQLNLFHAKREVITAFCCEIENAKQKFLLRHVVKDEAFVLHCCHCEPKKLWGPLFANSDARFWFPIMPGLLSFHFRFFLNG